VAKELGKITVEVLDGRAMRKDHIVLLKCLRGHLQEGLKEPCSPFLWQALGLVKGALAVLGEKPE